jgi:hypothetical protein
MMPAYDPDLDPQNQATALAPAPAAASRATPKVRIPPQTAPSSGAAQPSTRSAQPVRPSRVPAGPPGSSSAAAAQLEEDQPA